MGNGSMHRCAHPSLIARGKSGATTGYSAKALTHSGCGALMATVRRKSNVRRGVSQAALQALTLRGQSSRALMHKQHRGLPDEVRPLYAVIYITPSSISLGFLDSPLYSPYPPSLAASSWYRSRF